MRTRAVLLITIVLAGCTTAPAPPARPVNVAPTPQPAPPPPSPAGLDRVVGSDAAGLEALFGAADLDVRDGPARKLQFRSEVCVLDVYLYPPAAGGGPRATYTDARLPDGRDFDRASCIAALTRRPKPKG